MQSTIAPPGEAYARTAELRARVAARMRALVDARGGDGVYALAAYHLGWRDEDGTPCDAPAGKLLRPALLLLASRACGDAHDALDAAAAVELLHAFSLVHDDIEDGDAARHHRPTLWALHGVPLAINAGDCLFALAHRALADACDALPRDRAALASAIFGEACLSMIEGQHLDIDFESRATVPALDAYVRMVAGKTGALIGAALALGAIWGGASEPDVRAFQAAGVDLGIAFQAVDDALGHWGDPARTGKAVGADVARGKKTLPVVLARAGGTSDAPTLRAEVAAFAARHAARARARISGIAMAAEPARELQALIGFVLEREA